MYREPNFNNVQYLKRLNTNTSVQQVVWIQYDADQSILVTSNCLKKTLVSVSLK